MEQWVAGSFVEKNAFTTYNELLQLVRLLRHRSLLSRIILQSSIVPITDLVKQLIEFLSSASLIYCLTLALMSTTLAGLSEPSTSTADVSEKSAQNQTQTFSPIFLSSRSRNVVPSQPNNDDFGYGFGSEFNADQWLNEKDVEFEKENSTDSDALCPFKTARQAIDSFRLALSPYLSCYRQNFQMLIK